MVTDKRTFDERKKQIFDLCKTSQGKEDKLLLKALFAIANYHDKFGKEGKEKIAHTEFQGQTDSELMSNFMKDKFTNYGDKKLTSLFQELYNRAVIKNGNDPRYVVNVKKIEEGIMGFMETYSNSLEINKSLINRFKGNMSNNTFGSNALTVGPMFANVLLHETQHTCQMENILKYACGELTDKEDKARACMSLMKVVVDEIATKNEDGSIQDYLDKNYWFDFDEHDANMAPMYYINNLYKNGDIKDKIYCDVMHKWEEDSLGFKVDWSRKSKANKEFEDRMDNMEKVAKTCIEIFDKNTQDGEMKRDILNTLNEYMSTNEYGDSPFRERLRNDFNMCAQVFFNKDKYSKCQKVENNNELSY